MERMKKYRIERSSGPAGAKMVTTPSGLRLRVPSTGAVFASMTDLDAEYVGFETGAEVVLVAPTPPATVPPVTPPAPVHTAAVESVAVPASPKKAPRRRKPKPRKKA